MNLIFLREEEAQTSVEYTLLLCVAIGAFLIVSKNLIQPYLAKFANLASQQINQRMFQGDLHHFNAGGS